VNAPPAALLLRLAKRDSILSTVADHLLGPALPVKLAHSARKQACHPMISISLLFDLLHFLLPITMAFNQCYQCGFITLQLRSYASTKASEWSGSCKEPCSVQLIVRIYSMRITTLLVAIMVFQSKLPLAVEGGTH
jgi:hypothetical protein